MFPSSKLLGIQCPKKCNSAFCHFGHFTEDDSRVSKKRKDIDVSEAVSTVAGHQDTIKYRPPTVNVDWNSKIPQKQRQKAADKIYNEFKRIYQNLGQEQLIIDHTLKQELNLSKMSSKLTFTNNCIGLLRRLRQRSIAKDTDDIGIDGEYLERPITALKSLPIDEIEKLLVPLNILVEMEYPIWDNCKFISPSHVPPRIECDRCSNMFVLEENDVCFYHPLRFYKQYPCCLSDASSKGCTVGRHVFKVEHIRKYQLLPDVAKLPIIALDCEMGYTTMGMEVIRISAVDYHRNVLMDELVKPKGDILDLNTRFSGVHSLDGVEQNLDSVIDDKLFTFAGRNTVIVGHGLENDFIAMGICHERVLDTVALFPHSKGLPYRQSLKNLVKSKLGRFIQQGQHDSVEDAIACLDLVDHLLNQK